MRSEYLQTLAKLAITREYEPAQKVFAAGEMADGLYVIERGRIVLEAPYAGSIVPVQLIGPGHAIGWSSFCEPYEWQFNAKALDLCTVIFFRAAQIRERCAADYHLGYELTKRITRMMLQRLEATRDHMWQAFR
jgi:CRP-like cAMP-binding protein